MLRKIRAFADIGRAQGITTTASVALAGALTSTVQSEWYHVVYLTILASIAHMSLNTYIAKNDKELDTYTYIPSRNPLITGILTEKEIMTFVYAGTVVSIFFVFLYCLFINELTVWFSFFCFLVSYIWLLWYGWKGKKYLFSYDFSFSISYSFFVLFGVFIVGGTPTTYTWLFISVVFFAATAFAQWENGLKDVDADRQFGVKSLAVVTNVEKNEKLSFFHPYFLYGVLLKSGFVFCCFIALWFQYNILYLIFLLVYGIPSQLVILYRFLSKKEPLDHRRTILFDVVFTAILGFSILWGKIGVFYIVLLLVYLISGYLIGSFIQLHCEFKFSRFSKKV